MRLPYWEKTLRLAPAFARGSHPLAHPPVGGMRTTGMWRDLRAREGRHPVDSKPHDCIRPLIVDSGACGPWGLDMKSVVPYLNRESDVFLGKRAKTQPWPDFFP
jgi:hypothetical protein